MSGIKNKKVMTHLTGSIFLLNQEGIRTHIRWACQHKWSQTGRNYSDNHQYLPSNGKYYSNSLVLSQRSSRSYFQWLIETKQVCCARLCVLSSQSQYTVYSGITILVILVSVQWDCFRDPVTSFIGYNKLARETGSKRVPQNNPIGKYNSIKKIK